MRSVALFLALVLPFAATLPAWAQSNDAAYCSTLAEKYKRYAGETNARRGAQSANAQIDAAIAQCKTNSAAAIPALEQALKDAKVDLPPRG